MRDQNVYADLSELIYGIVGCVDRVSYYVKNPIEQKQNFYGEDRVKSAIERSEVIDGYDPIEYALLHRVFLNNKTPIIYAMENGIKINGIDPTLWAETNKYRIEIILTNENFESEERYINPVNYATEHSIKIEELDAKKWVDTIGSKRIEDEKKNRKDKLYSVVNVKQHKQKPVIAQVPSLAIVPPVENLEPEVKLLDDVISLNVEQPKIKPVVQEAHKEPEIEQPQKSPTATASSPTVDTEDPKPSK